MPLWGANTGDESKPKWLTEEEKSRVYADQRGWVIVRPDGKEEVLVAIRDLSGGVTTSTNTKLEAATISAVYFLSSSYEQDTENGGRVRVVWNERITPTTTGTLLIKDSVGSDITATRVGNTTSNFVDYQFTIPNTSTAVLSIPAQTITMGVNDYGSTQITSDLTIATSDVVIARAAKTGSTSVTVSENTPATITSVYFVSSSYATGATGKVRVEWDENITPTTTGTLVVSQYDADEDDTQNVTATRVGNTTSNFVDFTFDVGSSTALTYTIGAQTITLGVKDAGTVGTTSDLTIATEDVAGAGGGDDTSATVTAS